MTVRPDSMVSVQVDLSAETALQPTQPETIDPSAGVAVSVTVEPYGARPEHIQIPISGEQTMSSSVSVVRTIPLPVPEKRTDRE